jgi:SANT and BTB domain regulator of CSR, BTB domain
MSYRTIRSQTSGSRRRPSPSPGRHSRKKSSSSSSSSSTKTKTKTKTKTRRSSYSSSSHSHSLTHQKNAFAPSSMARGSETAARWEEIKRQARLQFGPRSSLPNENLLSSFLTKACKQYMNGTISASKTGTGTGTTSTNESTTVKKILQPQQSGPAPAQKLHTAAANNNSSDSTTVAASQLMRNSYESKPSTTSAAVAKEEVSDSSSTETVSQSPSVASSMSQASQVNIVIRVVDAARSTEKSFTCEKELLVTSMAYFKSYLEEVTNFEEVDICVHCDVYIFEWLMNFIQGKPDAARLNVHNCVSILISSAFLKMAQLTDICVRFVASHLQAVVDSPVDLSCLNDELLDRIEDYVDLDTMRTLHDSHNKLADKLYARKLQKSLHTDAETIMFCSLCRRLFTCSEHASVTCKAAAPHISFHGALIAQHQPDPNWTLGAYLRKLRSSGMQWGRIFWKLHGFLYSSSAAADDIALQNSISSASYQSEISAGVSSMTLNSYQADEDDRCSVISNFGVEDDTPRLSAISKIPTARPLSHSSSRSSSQSRSSSRIKKRKKGGHKSRSRRSILENMQPSAKRAYKADLLRNDDHRRMDDLIEKLSQKRVASPGAPSIIKRRQTVG